MDLECLLSRETVARRIVELGKEISDAGTRFGKPLTVVPILNGALVFTADLIRAINLTQELDSLAVASYSGDSSTGEVHFRAFMKLDVRGRDVLLVDDILDTGLTLARVKEYLVAHGAARVRTCVLLDKEVKRHPEGLASADFTAFRVPDRYIVGFGLDSEELGRNYPDVMAKPEPKKGINRQN